jgi:general secretion pathway protein I
LKKTTPKKGKGFTLLEILVAFTLLAVTFGTIMQIIAGSAKSTQKATQNTKVAMLAQSKMDELGLLEVLEEGSTSGDFDDRTSWTIQITPFDAPYEGDNNQNITAVELMEVTLVITSEHGRKRHSVEFNTLRAITPESTRGR